MNISVEAHHKFASISPQKVREVVKSTLCKGLPVSEALNRLSFSTRKAAAMLKKVLNSAIANAENNDGLDVDELVIKTVYVNEASRYKRFRARAKGRGNRIVKRNCHITVVVTD